MLTTFKQQDTSSFAEQSDLQSVQIFEDSTKKNLRDFWVNDLHAERLFYVYFRCSIMIKEKQHNIFAFIWIHVGGLVVGTRKEKGEMDLGLVPAGNSSYLLERTILFSLMIQKAKKSCQGHKQYE